MDQELKLCFKLVLILVNSPGHVLLDLFQGLVDVEWWLLVAHGWRFEISQCRLKLQRHVVIVEEAYCDSWVEGDTLQALVHQ